MLPSNPRTGRSTSIPRQPVAAQPRSASRPRERYAVEDERGTRGRVREGGSARQVRPQRSMGNLQPSRAIEASPPPLPRSDFRSSTARPSPSAYTRPPPSRDSDSSTSSLSSSGSSFLDRMRQRATASSSSQSSFELDLEAPKETRGVDDVRKRGLIRDGITPSARAEQEAPANDLASYGYSIWNRVATAASAWAWTGSSNTLMSGVASSSGDSEITRALKVYHISKARDRSDLPDWLFDEHERRVDSMPRSTSSDERTQMDAAEPFGRARGRGFRDIYDDAATPAPEPRARRMSDDSRQPGFGSDAAGPSKATNRLKALRDAKRQAASAGRATEPAGERSVNESGSDIVDAYDRRYEDRSLSGRGGRNVMGAREPAKRMPAARVGLPTNPRRR